MFPDVCGRGLSRMRARAIVVWVGGVSPAMMLWDWETGREIRERGASCHAATPSSAATDATPRRTAAAAACCRCAGARETPPLRSHCAAHFPWAENILSESSGSPCNQGACSHGGRVLQRAELAAVRPGGGGSASPLVVSSGCTRPGQRLWRAG
jgi:hypothetical protein